MLLGPPMQGRQYYVNSISLIIIWCRPTFIVVLVHVKELSSRPEKKRPEKCVSENWLRCLTRKMRLFITWLFNVARSQFWCLMCLKPLDKHVTNRENKNQEENKILHEDLKNVPQSNFLMHYKLNNLHNQTPNRITNTIKVIILRLKTLMFLDSMIESFDNILKEMWKENVKIKW